MQSEQTTFQSSRPNSNRFLSASVPLTAIAQAIPRKHRRMNRMVAQGREWKQAFLQTSWVRGYSSRHTGTKIAISLCKQFLTFTQLLAVPLTNPRVPDSPTVKIKTVKFLKPEFWPVLRNLYPWKLPTIRYKRHLTQLVSLLAACLEWVGNISTSPEYTTCTKIRTQQI